MKSDTLTKITCIKKKIILWLRIGIFSAWENVSHYGIWPLITAFNKSLFNNISTVRHCRCAGDMMLRIGTALVLVEETELIK